MKKQWGEIVFTVLIWQYSNNNTNTVVLQWEESQNGSMRGEHIWLWESRKFHLESDKSDSDIGDNQKIQYLCFTGAALKCLYGNQVGILQREESNIGSMGRNQKWEQPFYGSKMTTKVIFK